MSSAVTHLEILGPDRAALVAFYGAVFGWSFDAYDEMNYTIFRTAPGGIGGGLGTQEDGATSVCLYAEVDDLDAKLAQAKDLGATATTGPIDIGGGSKIGTITDPAGNTFGMHQGDSSSETPEGTGTPVVWFDLIGPAEANLGAFYTTLFAWTISDPAGGYAHITPTAPGIGGGLTTPMPGGPNHALYGYMQVDNLEDSLKAILEAGGSEVMGRQKVSDDLSIALFTDVAGNLNGLCEMTASTKA